MEDYLQHLKSLRSHMNDFEQQLSEITVEKHKQQTAIRTTEKDLEIVRAEVKRLDEDIDQMSKEKGHVSCLILSGHKNIVKLEADSSALSQALELLQQEIVKHSTALRDKRSYYEKFTNEMNAKLQEYQNHFESRELEKAIKKVEQRIEMARNDIEAKSNDKREDPEGKCKEMHLQAEEKYMNVMDQLKSAQIELDNLMENSFDAVHSDNCQMKLAVEQLQYKCTKFPGDLNDMNFIALEEEMKALLSDKAGEEDYLASLKERIDQLKAVSQQVKCGSCGEEYKVELTESSMQH